MRLSWVAVYDRKCEEERDGMPRLVTEIDGRNFIHARIAHANDGHSGGLARVDVFDNITLNGLANIGISSAGRDTSAERLPIPCGCLRGATLSG